MTGIFDSGAGGLAALHELRRLLPSEDILFLADTKNAPYGTKSGDEIISVATENIKRLKSAGAERVLIACCTASAFHSYLPKEERESSVPIIAPAALEATRLSKNGRIAVIATALSVKSHAFKRAIQSADGSIRVFEKETQCLVEIAERVAHGEELSQNDKDTLCDAVSFIKETGADTLVLGCTHFSHLEDKIKELTNGIATVNSAKIGARLLARTGRSGFGRTVLLEI